MTLNRNKSGILLINHKYQPGDIDSFPYVSEYKYLGTSMTEDLEPESHLRTIGRKSDFQARRLAPLHHCLDLKFNVNLFKLLIMPGICILGSVHRHTSNKGKGKI